MSTDTYDYVVVGAGSAGCVIASRLTEAPGSRVLLLEAGGKDSNPWIHVPAGYYRTIFHPRLSWNFETEPDPGMADRAFRWPRGRVLGGSSAINGLLYVRGQAEDFDHWRQLGAAGWAWADVLPYFKRSERQARGADSWHGADGPLGVSDIDERHALCEAFVAAAVAAGLPRNDDFNGAVQDGAGYFQMTTLNGWRSSAATAFLKPARRRPNLRILTGALATRVRFEGRRAVGVEYRRGGTLRFARAAREVVLCGGTVNSPQLLELSGIGAGAALRALGIDVVHDLPGVGENMQDHVQARMVFRLRAPISLNDDRRRPHKLLGFALDWAWRGRGPLGVASSRVGAFARVRPGAATPDVQYCFLPMSLDRPGAPFHPFPGCTLVAYQLRPESRGSIHLRSADPSRPPAIRTNYLSARLDREIAVDAIRLGRRIAAAPPLRDLIAAEHEPGEGARDDDEILDYVRTRGGTVFHPVGTCRMGADEAAVVDPALRVRGVAGLRVADASIMPTMVSGNTNAAAIMIGEKAADLIREAG